MENFPVDPTGPIGAPSIRTADINVMVATPMYGGISHASYNRSILGLHDLFSRYGIHHAILDIPSESLIPRGRNAFANICAFDADAEGKEYSHLLFIDADIGFLPDNILQALAFNKDIVALPYACKDIQWNKIVRAVQKGITDPVILSRMGSRPIVNTNEKAIQFNTNHPAQFPQLGTGALLIKKSVLLKFAEDPERRYRLMAGEARYGPREFAYDFFQIGINKKTRFYDSEDYRFCLDAREMGFETWLLPWAVTSHTGNYTFFMDIPGQATYGMTEDNNNAPLTGVNTVTLPPQGGYSPLTIVQ